MIGYLGYGEVLVRDGGTLRGPVRIAFGTDSFGVLTVGGLSTPEAPGVIDAPSITFGAGEGGFCAQAGGRVAASGCGVSAGQPQRTCRA